MTISYSEIVPRILFALTIAPIIHYSQFLKKDVGDVAEMVDVTHAFLDPLRINILKDGEHIGHLMTTFATLIVDSSILFMTIVGIFYDKSWRTLMSVVLTLVLRQICQFLVFFPIPKDMFWKDPGFPTLFVQYEIANDLYYSGHTSLIVMATLVMIRRGYAKPLVYLGICLSVYQMIYLLVFQLHYIQDVVTGLFAPFFIEYITESLENRTIKSKFE